MRGRRNPFFFTSKENKIKKNIFFKPINVKLGAVFKGMIIGILSIGT